MVGYILGGGCSQTNGARVFVKIPTFPRFFSEERPLVLQFVANNIRRSEYTQDFQSLGKLPK